MLPGYVCFPASTFFLRKYGLEKTSILAYLTQCDMDITFLYYSNSKITLLIFEIIQTNVNLL